MGSNSNSLNSTMNFTEASISGIPGSQRLITAHNGEGKAVAGSIEPVQWQSMRNGAVCMSLIYTTSEPLPNLNEDADIKKHNEKVAAGKVGLVSPGGSVCRLTDFSPSNDPQMHRTKSLDYGILMEGEMELILDSGEVHLMKKGDVAVQRGTMHAWRNPSSTQWARMLFVLLDCQPLEVAGNKLGEVLAPGQHEMPASGNDTNSAREGHR
ncbi:Cupin domain-containing protein [Cladophialophora immunda]|nr:Cupin domain-containing protein [Cladophialophora immunda]